MSLKLKIIVCALLCTVFVCGICGCTAQNEKKVTKSGFYLDTVITITLYGTKNEKKIDECFAICERYEKLLSATLPESEIYRLNTREISTVSDNTAQLLEKGLYYSALSNGAFDITVGTLTSLWDFKSENHVLPESSAIAQALTHVGYEKVTLNGNEVTFSDPQTKIDLGAIAKGYIADKIKEYLMSENINSATINLGGNVLCVGEKPDKSAFNIGLQYPFGKQNETIAVVQLKDISVVTSGVYQRYFYKDDVLYHHILDTSTGYPIQNSLYSVTILSTHSVDGDALSTVCFALGKQRATALIESMDGVYALFVDSDYTLTTTRGTENVCVIK